MARLTHELEQTSAGSTSWHRMNKYSGAKSIFIHVSGSATYSVEHTPNVDAAGPWVFQHESLVSQTEHGDGNYAYPVDAVRITVHDGSGTVYGIIIEE